eukprot:3446573-Pleurochrysis_carterae.AAC.1
MLAREPFSTYSSTCQERNGGRGRAFCMNVCACMLMRAGGRGICVQVRRKDRETREEAKASGLRDAVDIAALSSPTGRGRRGRCCGHRATH